MKSVLLANTIGGKTANAKAIDRCELHPGHFTVQQTCQYKDLVDE